VVARAGWGQQGDRRRAMEAGFDYHLTKPVDPGVLNDLLVQVATT
jgi:CheY-like chemotaxis protein